MFPEYRDLITQLKTTDSHFLNVYEKHNELDQRIRNMNRASNRQRTLSSKR